LDDRILKKEKNMTKKVNKVEKTKTIAKYIVNTLNMINMLLLGLAEIWNWNIDKISATIIVIAGIGSAWFTTGKIFDKGGK
jgi:hypothetical protein